LRSLVGGNPNLNPESGTTKSFGVVYSPKWLEGLDVTLDWFNIKLKDALAFRGAASIINSCYGTGATAADQAQFCPLIDRNPDGSINFVNTTQFNLGQGEVEGYDMQVRYRLPETSFGNFAVQLDNTYQTKNNLFGTIGEYNGSPTWRLRSNVSVTWRKGDWDATWTSRYYSALDEACPIADAYYFSIGLTPQRICSDVLDSNGNILREEHHIGAVVFHDLQVGWKTPWNGRIAVGGRNIFGREPPKALNSFAGNFDGAYDLPGGGYYYIQYSQKF
jgi:iron complex outermembrane receptor protein